MRVRFMDPPSPLQWLFRGPRLLRCLFRRHLPPSCRCSYHLWIRRAQSQAPPSAQGDYGRFTHDELNDLCRRRGYAREDLKAALETRPAAMGAVDQKREIAKDGGVGTSGALPSKRGRALEDAVKNSEGLPGNEEKRCRVGDPHPACVADKEVAKSACPGRRPKEISPGGQPISSVLMGGVHCDPGL